MAQTVKNLPAMQKTWIQSLGWKEPLEKEIRLPTPVFLPGEFHGQKSLVGYSPWGCEESDTTERLSTAQLVAQMVKNLSARQETWFGCLG